jgi:glycosyltransferase involved in cell wall biosynthesis
MIHICHLISSCLTNHGPGNIVLDILGRADYNRYRFSVWSLYPPPNNRDPGRIIHDSGGDYKAFKMGSFLDLRILAPLVRQMRLSKPDILHCHLVRANIYGRVAAQLAGVPRVICTHHGIEDYMVSSNLRDQAVRSLEYFTDRWVNCHVGVSEGMRQAAMLHLRIAPDKIVAIPNGVDIGLFDCDHTDRMVVRQELGLDPHAVVVGSVGILNQTKNFKLMVQIAQSALARHRNLQFIIVGDGDQRSELETVVTNLGLRKAIVLAGFRTDIPRVLKALDIFALTSRSEGFCLAVAEAMASGLPCVAFDVGALGELVVDGHTGFLVAAGDAEKFGIMLDQLIAAPELRTIMGCAAQLRAKDLFSVDIMVRRYNELYDRLLNASKDRYPLKS